MAPIIVALMGLTGSGKSSLVNLLLGEEKALVGHSLQSETSSVTTYQLYHRGTFIQLVDTPGFNDTYHEDADILRCLYNWLRDNFEEGRKLNGIIYLHNITDNRMTGKALSNLYSFKRLCGSNFYSSVLLGTTFWRNVDPSSMHLATSRERELETTDSFWENMLAKGARATRMPDTRGEALQLLDTFVEQPAKAMQVQVEAVHQGKTFQETSAHETLADRALDEIRERFQRESSELRVDAAAERERNAQALARAAEAAERQRQADREADERQRARQEAAAASPSCGACSAESRSRKATRA